MTQETIETWLASWPNTWLDFPYGKDIAVYKFGDKDTEDGKLFALVERGSVPVRLSLRSDPQLAVLLREKYETILPAKNLNKKYWNTIICSGQLDEEALKDLIRHAYQEVQK
ncbi:hypothetical protein CYG49_03200 [Candidatus Saccharibacteria bacterium]|nr:MAG: hypothetical protein CYG49_03200 [Candidatus Saccharibacteria bacterium]